MKPTQLVALSILFSASPVLGAEPSPNQWHEVLVGLEGRTEEVAHLRRPYELGATFAIPAVPLTQALDMEVYSQGKGKEVLRWRCVAVDSTTDCFARTLTLSFLPSDERLTLRITRSRESTPGVRKLTLARL